MFWVIILFSIILISVIIYAWYEIKAVQKRELYLISELNAEKKMNAMAERHMEQAGRAMSNMVKEHEVELKKARADSSKRASAISVGKVTENIVPLLGDFKYQLSDCVFVGEKIDFIIFNGLTSGKLRDIIFYEVKTGKSNLNKREKQVKDCINRKDVKYIKATIDKNGSIKEATVRTNRKVK